MDGNSIRKFEQRRSDGELGPMVGSVEEEVQEVGTGLDAVGVELNVENDQVRIILDNIKIKIIRNFKILLSFRIVPSLHEIDLPPIFLGRLPHNRAHRFHLPIRR